MATTTVTASSPVPLSLASVLRGIRVDRGLTVEQVADQWDCPDSQRALDRIAPHMNPELRDLIHDRHSPCTPAEFLAAYLRQADEDLVIG